VQVTLLIISHGEFFLQFLDLLDNDEGVRSARFVRIAGSSTFADQKEKGIYRCQEF
jgi:hypothetical protein